MTVVDDLIEEPVDEEAVEEAQADAEWEATPTELAPDVEHEVADLDDRPIAVEAFAGIGGVGLGLERAGFQSAVQIEWDAAASRVLAKRFPRAARFGDVRKVDGQSVRRALGGRAVRLLAGGFPCQDLSVAGKRAGLAGERSGLYGELLRLAEELTPDWLLVENVPGLLSSESGADFALFLGDVTGWRPAVPDGGWRNSGVAHGPRATAAWRVLDARYFGVAQRRRRVFVVVRFGDRVAPAAVLLEPSGLRRHPASRVPSWARPAPGPVGAAVRGRGERADGGGTDGPAPDVAATLGYASRQPGPDEAAGGLIVPLEGGITADEGVVTALTHGLGSGGPDAAHAQAGWLVPGERQIGHIEAHGGPDLGSTVTSKWSKGSGGPAGSETPNLIVVGDGGEDVTHPVTASGTDGMGRGVPAVAYGVTAKGNGEASQGGTLAVEGAQVFRKSRRAATNTDDETWVEAEHANTLNTFDGGDARATEVIVEPVPFIVEPESGQGADLVLRPTDHSPALTSTQLERSGERGVRVAVGVDVYNGALTDGVAQTLRGGHDQGAPRVVEGPRSAVRRLTPRECERLQGFPDDWTLVPDKNGKPQADSPRYKQLGNAVCATVSEWVGGRVLDYDDGTLYEDLPA